MRCSVHRSVVLAESQASLIAIVLADSLGPGLVVLWIDPQRFALMVSMLAKFRVPYLHASPYLFQHLAICPAGIGLSAANKGPLLAGLGPENGVWTSKDFLPRVAGASKPGVCSCKATVGGSYTINVVCLCTLPEQSLAE